MNDKLICGCGGEIKTENLNTRIANPCWCSQCTKCGVNVNYHKSKSDAISAFRKATRADKQGIQWISVKDRLPKKKRGSVWSKNVWAWKSAYCTGEIEVSAYNHKEKIWQWRDGDITHWAVINLPEDK